MASAWQHLHLPSSSRENTGLVRLSRKMTTLNQAAGTANNPSLARYGFRISYLSTSTMVNHIIDL